MFQKTVILLFVAGAVFANVVRKEDDRLNLIKKAFERNNASAYFKAAFQKYNVNTGAEPKLDTNCIMCKGAANGLLALKKAIGMDAVIRVATEVCQLLNIENDRVCTGIINTNANIFGYIVDQHPNITSDRICSLLLHNDASCTVEGAFEWTIDIPEGQTIEKPKPGNSSFTILQLSDFHYDPIYTPNKLKTCDEPLCCQNDQDDGDSSNGTTCGYWTEYKKADVPMHTVEEVLRQVKTHDFDYVYFTGDIISHRVWATSAEGNTKAMKDIFAKLKETFKVPVYPILGNHEPSPVNAWSTSNVSDQSLSTEWLFKLIAEEWSEWLPENATDTLLQGGFYTVSPRKGFRVIVINNNVAYNENWWILDDDYDQYGQLSWLAKTLKEAEDNKESVHLLSHVPSGSGVLLRSYAREFNKIIQRFANTITAQFNGHSHSDDFVLYYNKSNPAQAVNVAWNGASVIADNSNPSYKLYQIDDSSYSVLDQEEWTFNLTKANLENDKTPDWYKLYSFKDAYGVDSLEPSELSDLIYNRMTKDHSILTQYHAFRRRNGDLALEKGCDEDCQKSYLCIMSTSEYVETSHCEELKKIYDENK